MFLLDYYKCLYFYRDISAIALTLPTLSLQLEGQNTKISLTASMLDVGFFASLKQRRISFSILMGRYQYVWISLPAFDKMINYVIEDVDSITLHQGCSVVRVYYQKELITCLYGRTSNHMYQP